ncbi:MAG: hypothetical protein K9L68_10615 [Spirochaetales bacterium]|nr:hypothetical protein [Spirochaetales bacterium]MCF7939036.1 hypothetical protein [Spirochaetales bacterium]
MDRNELIRKAVNEYLDNLDFPQHVEDTLENEETFAASQGMGIFFAGGLDYRFTSEELRDVPESEWPEIEKQIELEVEEEYIRRVREILTRKGIPFQDKGRTEKLQYGIGQGSRLIRPEY